MHRKLFLILFLVVGGAGLALGQHDQQNAAGTGKHPTGSWSGELEGGDGSEHNPYVAGFVSRSFGNRIGLGCTFGFDFERVGPRQASLVCGPKFKTENASLTFQVGGSSEREWAFFTTNTVEYKGREIEYLADARLKPGEYWWLRQRFMLQAWKQIYFRSEGLLTSHEEEYYGRFGPEFRKRLKFGQVYFWPYLDPVRTRKLNYGAAAGFRF